MSFALFDSHLIKIKLGSREKNMSTPKDRADSEDYSPEGRIVTDSVHERLRQPSVYCPSCQENIPASDTEIEKHFTPTHKSETRCLYCQGKVFKYLSFQVDDVGNKIPKDETYHSCRLGK